MGLRQTLELANRALIDAGVDHALIGGFALAHYHVARATQDIDFIVDEKQRELVKKTLESVGFKISGETQEVIHFEGPGFLDVLLARRPLSQQMLKNAQVIAELGIRCISAEDIIGLKIQAYVNQPKRALQDKADIQALIEKNSINLDWEKIKQYADLFGEWETIETIRKQI